MAISISEDIRLFYTNRTNSAGQSDSVDPTTAATAATRSLGKYISQGIPTTAKHQIVPAFSSGECSAGVTKYRALAIANLNDEETWDALWRWLTQLAGGANVSFAADPTGVVALGQVAVQGLETTSELTIPTGLVSGDFFSVADRASARSVGPLGPNQGRIFWLRWVVAPGTGSLSDDSLAIVHEGTG
jgi:hypothetical protein